MLLGDWIWVMVIYDSCNCRSRKCCHSSLVVQIQSQTQLLIRFKLLIERHRLTSECLIQPWKLSLTKARPAQKTPQPSGDLPPWREDGAGGASSSASRPPVVSVDDSNDDPPESLEDAVQKMLETAVKDDVMSLDPQVSGCFFVCFLPSKLRLAELVYPRMPNDLQWDVVCVCVCLGLLSFMIFSTKASHLPHCFCLKCASIQGPRSWTWRPSSLTWSFSFGGCTPLLDILEEHEWPGCCSLVALLALVPFQIWLT